MYQVERAPPTRDAEAVLLVGGEVTVLRLDKQRPVQLQQSCIIFDGSTWVKWE